MKLKNNELEWYVLRWDVNIKGTTDYNIFAGLTEDLCKNLRAKKITNKNELKEYLKRKFMYYYWSKTECEMYISDLHGNDYEKVDMWKQIKPNLNNIVDYVNTKYDLKF